MSTNRTAKRTATTNTPAREAYISFNRDEWAALELVGYRERWTYMQLKWLANFKTGVVGNFGKQKLTYTALAKLITAPGVQGRGMGNTDDTQARDILQRLQAVGLVGDINTRTKGGLTFDLLLSPINRKSTKSTGQVAEQAAPLNISPEQEGHDRFIFPDQPDDEGPFSPDDDVPSFLQERVSTGLAADFPFPQSVMTLKESNNNTGVPPTAYAAGAPHSRSPFAAASPELTAQGNTKPLPPGQRTLSARDIQQNLADDWTCSNTDTYEALALYRKWSMNGITQDLLDEAKEADAAGQDPHSYTYTPMALAPFLANRLSA